MKLEIFLAFAVPALSGLAYLAYKHPKAYKKLFAPLYFISITCFGVLSAWDAGIWISNIKIKEKFPNIDAKAIESTLEPWTIPYLWLIIGYLCFCFYLLFLSYLPHLIEEDEPKK